MNVQGEDIGLCDDRLHKFYSNVGRCMVAIWTPCKRDVLSHIDNDERTECPASNE